MIILGADTSCEQASCAVYKDGVITERRSAIDKRKHSETFMPMVDSLLAELGLNAGDIDLFAVSSGPGSFTGLRIGMAAMKGLAYSTGSGMVLIKTLDVLANTFEENQGTVCPVIDARNNQVYTAIYEWDEGFYKPVTEYSGIKIGELTVLLENKEKVSFCGDAALKHHEYFKGEGINCGEPGFEVLYPSAGVLVRMAAAGLGDRTKAEEAVPYYLRVSQAERFHGKR